MIMVSPLFTLDVKTLDDDALWLNASRFGRSCVLPCCANVRPLLQVRCLRHSMACC